MILILGTDLEVRDLDLAPGVECTIESSARAGIMMKTVAMNSDCIMVYMKNDINVDIPEAVKEKVKVFTSDNELKALLSGKEEVAENTATFDLGDTAVEKSDVSEEKNEEIVENNVVFDEIASIDDVYEDKMSEADTSLPDDFISIKMEDSSDITEKQLEAKDNIIKQKDIMIKELNESRDDLLARHKSAIEEIKAANERKVSEYENAIDAYKKEIEKAKDIVKSDVVKRATLYSTHSKVVIKEGYKEDGIASNIYTIACNTHEDVSYVAKRLEKFIKEGCLLVDFTNDYIIASLISAKVDNRESVNKNSLKVINGGNVADNVVKLNEKSELILSDIYHDIVFLNTNWLDVVKRLSEYANGKDIVMVFGSIKSFSVMHAVAVLTSITNTSLIMRSSPINIQTLYGAIRFIPNTKEQRLKIVATECTDKVKPMLSKIGETRTVCMMELVSSDEMYDIVKR